MQKQGMKAKLSNGQYKQSLIDSLAGLGMIAPTIIGLIILNIYPFLRTVWMSFHKSGSFGKWTFIGMKNYADMFSSSDFWRYTGNTMMFALFTVPLTIMIAMFIAVLLNQKIGGKAIFRGIYFLPMVVAPAAIAMVWKWMLNTEFGIVNIILGFLGVTTKVNWITNPSTVLFACSVVTIWSSIGYDAILLLSGLQSIPTTYYEAATIDGASPVRKFFSITLPMVSPTMFFVVIMRIMAAIKIFDVIYMMVEQTNPAIKNAKSLMYYFYRESFVMNNKGYGSALALWMVLIIALVTYVQFLGQKKWVNYDV